MDDDRGYHPLDIVWDVVMGPYELFTVHTSVVDYVCWGGTRPAQSEECDNVVIKLRNR